MVCAYFDLICKLRDHSVFLAEVGLGSFEARLENRHLLRRVVPLFLQRDHLRVQSLFVELLHRQRNVLLAGSIVLGHVVSELGQVRSLGCRLDALADVRELSWIAVRHWVGRYRSASLALGSCSVAVRRVPTRVREAHLEVVGALNEHWRRSYESLLIRPQHHVVFAVRVEEGALEWGLQLPLARLLLLLLQELVGVLQSLLRLLLFLFGCCLGGRVGGSLHLEARRIEEVLSAR